MLNKESIKLREWLITDEKKLFESLNNPNILANLGDNYSKISNTKNISNYINNSQEHNNINLAIIIDNIPIGGIKLKINNKTKIGTIEYWLGESYWNKGIMTEVLTNFSKEVFKNKDINTIEARVYSWNLSSAHILQKIGYNYKETIKNASLKNHNPVDIMIYSCISDNLK